MNWKKIWDWIEHNRFTVVVPLIAIVLWGVAVGCTPQTRSPLSGEMVNAAELQVDFETTMIRFDFAAEDLKVQAESTSKFMEILLGLASGDIANAAGLMQMLLSSGLIGFALDNVRKNGVIGGLKRNKSGII